MSARRQGPLAAILEVSLPQPVTSHSKEKQQNIYKYLQVATLPLHFLIQRIRSIKRHSVINGKASILVSLWLCQ